MWTLLYRFGTTVVDTFQFLCFIIHVTYNYYFKLNLQKSLQVQFKDLHTRFNCYSS